MRNARRFVGKYRGGKENDIKFNIQYNKSFRAFRETNVLLTIVLDRDLLLLTRKPRLAPRLLMI